MSVTTSSPDVLLTKSDVAKLLQVTPRTIENLLRAGRLPQPMRLGSHPRWLQSHLTEWLRQQAMHAAGGGQ